MGNNKSQRLFQRAKNSPYGWSRSQLDQLYKCFGFIIIKGSKHDIVKHLDLPSSEKATLTRSSGEIHPDYIRRAVELIEMLSMEGEDNGQRNI